MNILCSVLAVLITAPISMWLTSMAPMRVRLWVIKLLQPFARFKKREFSIGGFWDANYVKGDNINDSTTDVRGYHRFKLYQFGNIVVGEAKTNDTDAMVVGELKKYDVFDGIYVDPRDNTEYHGTFQVIFDDKHKEMRGRWIGFNNDTKTAINNGIWIWTRSTNKPL